MAHADAMLVDERCRMATWPRRSVIFRMVRVSTRTPSPNRLQCCCR
jgi:hypothetical protein